MAPSWFARLPGTLPLPRASEPAKGSVEMLLSPSAGSSVVSPRCARLGPLYGHSSHWSGRVHTARSGPYTGPTLSDAPSSPPHASAATRVPGHCDGLFGVRTDAGAL